jgi:hypothetical protein
MGHCQAHPALGPCPFFGRSSTAGGGMVSQIASIRDTSIVVLHGATTTSSTIHSQMGHTTQLTGTIGGGVRWPGRRSPLSGAVQPSRGSSSASAVG